VELWLLCILLVEDEFLIRDLAQQVLEDAGHEVFAAEHGHQAYEFLAIHPGLFTCLVTDYHMPGAYNGGHVVEHMRLFYPGIPMILASAYLHITTSEWRDLHDVNLLVKPYFQRNSLS
jgi:CheY-like chemotaxis protein